MTRKFRRRNKSPPSRGTDLEAQPQDEEVRQREAHEMRTRTSGRNDKVSGASGSNAPAEEADHEDQAGSSTRPQAQAQRDGPSNSGDDHQPGRHGTPSDASQLGPPEMTPRVIGDFDVNANAMWSLHMKEAKSHDEARFQSLKDDMDGVLIFAGLFSASLTSFIIDKIHDLQANPAQQMVYYQQQNVALLAQISTQVSSIAPQVSIPSTPPPPYVFSLSPSDVRVNAFWFMSLVFSLSAALLATLVQQWVRDYMHVFQRYSNPLKSARLRQYLYEGAEGWYMPIVAESVPGLVHVSLFLFFVGIGDSLLALNTTIAITTIVPIAICGLLYVLSMFAPILNPQSPFRNPFSGLIWYVIRKVRPRTYSDRAFSGAVKTVSLKLSEGQAQLAMEENDERKGRDVRAIQWLIDNSTEDDEMESFVMAIPGTFMSTWGIEVWRKVSEVTQYEDADLRPNDLTVRSQMEADFQVSVLPHPGSLLPQRTFHPPSLFRNFGQTFWAHTLNRVPHDVMATRSISHARNDPHAARDLAIYDLCRCTRHLLDTCDNSSRFTSKELWRKRARGCVETATSLVFCADVKLELFGDFERLLSKLGEFEKIRELSALSVAGSDGTFVTRWTCLSLVVITSRIPNNLSIELFAGHAIKCLALLQIEDGGERAKIGGIGDSEKALENSRKIDKYFETAKGFCLNGLRRAFNPDKVGRTEEQVREVLARDHEADISMLESVAATADRMERIDRNISHVYSFVNQGLGVHLPGGSFDKFKRTELIQPIEFFNAPVAERPAFRPQFVCLGQRLRLLCSYASKLRDVIDGRGNGVYQEVLGGLGILWNSNGSRSVVGQRHLMERQLWRLLDLRDGDGFGFSVERFFLVLPQLLSIASPQGTHSALYIGTFRAITSGWRQHKDCLGTQRVILNLICDIAVYGRGITSNHTYPEYITDELLVLLGNMVEGQSGSHIDDAMEELRSAPSWFVRSFTGKATGVISRSRAGIPSS